MCHLSWLAVLAFVAGANACCAPELFSAGINTNSFVDGQFFHATGELYYDYKKGVHASFVNITIDEFKGVYSLTSTHLDINTGVVYTMREGTCTKTKLDLSWVKETDLPHCIPKAAHLDDDIVIGGPHEDIEMQSYIHDILNGRRRVTITKTHCFPVQEVYFYRNATHNDHNFGEGTVTQVRDLELTISDPSVLEIPALCKKIPYTNKQQIPGLSASSWRLLPYLAQHSK